MVWYFLLATLAAIGLLSILWVFLGWLLPAGKGCALVCVGQPDIGVLSRWKWLQGMGLLKCPLIAVTETEALYVDSEIEQISREALLARLETERDQFDRTGNGDPPGHHRCRGISEL